ncbi:3D domain-containing protein [Tumebacillus permanentifrigoris]|uniref:3D (Asp-Asp-Asp) domain-containing protein n=1 Tax=Tumebacillus permanentifrigoris TaxID=378543 RepID=A0A316D6C3_9BACL|nr:3D domain-containing protein [Tumebacillus permanentifrigoris]PWK10276.1 3D (Asp-Asp-Asp) domain-containing protein [Tumebacillus permanentifrigoris]
MKKTVLALVFSLLLLCSLFAAPSYALYETSAPLGAPHTFASTGLVYGPPIPNNAPPIIARSGTDLLKKVEQAIPETLTYKVKKGDTLSTIAAAFHTKTDTLAQLNELPNSNLLKIDQEIQIPNLEGKLLEPGLTVKHVLSADLTAYTAGFESTGKRPGDPAYGVTASGKYVKDHQTIAVDPAVIPLGTKVYIEGIGVRIAEDTGGAIIGNRIDVYMNDLSAAVQFGYKKSIKVYVLDSNQSA